MATWNSANNGSWILSSSWSGGVPNAAGATAVFPQFAGSIGSILVSIPDTVSHVTVGRLEIETSATSFRYSISSSLNNSQPVELRFQGADNSPAVLLVDTNGRADGISFQQRGGGGYALRLVSDLLVVTRNSDTTLDLPIPILGTGRLMKSGSGVLNLAGSNAFTGGFDLLAGQVNASAGTAFGTGAIMLRAGTLVTTANTTITNLIATGFDGSFSPRIGASTGTFLTLDAAELLLLDDGGSLRLGSSTLNGTIVLSANGFHHRPGMGIKLDGGTIRLGDALNAEQALRVQGSGLVELAAGVTLDTQGFATTINNLDFDGGTLAATGSPLQVTVNYTNPQVNNTGTVSGNLLFTDRLTFVLTTADSLNMSTLQFSLWSPTDRIEFIGSSGNDTISGTSRNDSVSGNAGQDLIQGNSGSDSIGGGLDNDTLSGNAGADLLTGDDGNDTLDGGTENDTLDGGRGNDSLFGDSGADVLTGGDGNDTLEGGTENDTLDGGTGGDVLFGEDGNDALNGSAGDDTLFGDAGSDTITGGLGNDALFGDFGADLLIGSDGNDTLSGNLDNDTLDGGLGDDSLLGEDGADLLTGGDGNDTLLGLNGNDTLDGGLGSDLLKGADGADSMQGGDGNDTVSGGIDNDTLDGGLGDDDLLADAGADLLTGGDGSDTLSGGSDGDTLDGGLGNDLLQGDDGADFLIGSEGDDTLNGGSENDTLGGSIGNDSLLGGIGDDSLSGFNGNDTLSGEAGADSLQGGLGVDVLFGGSENDRLQGDGGADTLAGDDGDDVLLGGDNSDQIDGGAGNDTITGGFARDDMTGGLGADRFVWNLNDFGTGLRAGADRVADFSQADGDVIDLSLIDASTALAGNNAFTFIGAAAFSGVGGQLRFVQATGHTYIEGDRNGDGTADFAIRLDGLITLGAGDFLL